MTERKTPADAAPSDEPLNPGAAEGGAGAGADPAAPDVGDATPADAAAMDPASRVAELEAEVADLRDKALRALAEGENVRRRAQRDKEDAFKYAVTAFAREMLTVADNLARALASVDRAAVADDATKALVEGVEMTERAMLAAFERAGIRRIETSGRRFDHNLHEAMLEMDDPAKPQGTVVQEFEPGYLLNDRLLRPAKVAVAKGGPPAPAEGAAADDAAKTDGRAKRYEKSAGQSGSQVDENL
jgi:molecular chaperone GrpE